MDKSIASANAKDKDPDQKEVKKQSSLSAKQKQALKQWNNGKIEILLSSTCH